VARLTTATAAALVRRTGRPVMVPMTLVVPEYFEAVMGTLSGRGSRSDNSRSWRVAPRSWSGSRDALTPPSGRGPEVRGHPEMLAILQVRAVHRSFARSE